MCENVHIMNTDVPAGTVGAPPLNTQLPNSLVHFSGRNTSYALQTCQESENCSVIWKIRTSLGQYEPYTYCELSGWHFVWVCQSNSSEAPCLLDCLKSWTQTKTFYPLVVCALWASKQWIKSFAEPPNRTSLNWLFGVSCVALMLSSYVWNNISGEVIGSLR